MMRKKIVSLCMALALCLGLLPVTALAAENDRPYSLYVGNTDVAKTEYSDNAAYWTSSDGGTNWTSQLDEPTADSYIHYDGNGTLTLHNVNISRSNENGIYAEAMSGSAVSLTIKLEGTNTVSGWSGIFVHTVYGAASLSISGTGSLTAEGTGGGSFSGIQVQSNDGKAELTINNVDVTATNNVAQGIILRSGGSSTASLTVNGGELTASGSDAGIKYVFGSSGTGDGTPTVTVSDNAIVRANGGISDDSSTDIQIDADSNESNGGIVFDGKNGTVYGVVTLQEDITIGEGESLTIPDGASLTIGNDATLTNEGTVTNSGTLTNNGTIDNSGTLTGTISGNAPPSITTTSPLARGTVGTEYSVTLEANNSTSGWSVTSGSLPDGLSLNETTGVISGTPTAQGTSGFTVTATNGGGSDSKSLSITIGAAALSITTQPSNQSVTEGQTASFSVAATGNGTLTYQWQESTDNGATWANISGANAATYTIENTTTAMSGYQYHCVVTDENSTDVTSRAATLTVTAATVSVTGVSLDKTELSLTVGGTEALTATVAPDNATNRAVTWASSNPSVAKVENGVVTALACGTAVITATTQDGNHTATCAVTVRPDIPPANPNYRITVEATQGGTVTADPTAAKAGTTVTLTPVPDRGYQVGAVAVTDRFGDAVAVTEQADGTYTFTMPNGQVTVTVTFEQAPLPFHDVTEGDWFYDAVRCAYENSLMDGVGDNLFAPNSQTTRAQLVTILYRLAGEPEPGGDSGFSDVAAGTWYTDAVAWAAENGIVNGTTDTTFAPGEDITREQLVTVLYRYAESKGYDVNVSADLSGYPDAGQVQDYAQPAMAWAVAEGIVEGVDGNLNPTGDATRAQIATILMRFCEGVAK